MNAFGFATVTGATGRQHVAIVRDDQVWSLAACVPGAPETLRELLPDWDYWCDAVETSLADAPSGASALTDVQFAAAVPDPPTIYAAAANYVDHAEEMTGKPFVKKDGGPFHFLLPPASLTGHRRPIGRPRNISTLDWEAELAVVIGRAASDVGHDDALSYVAGYTIANDVSAREAGVEEIFGVRWLPMKGRPGFLPLGPAVIPSRFVPDPMNLAIGLDVNGTPRQNSSTSKMIYSVQEQLVHLSGITTLLPGDILLTGTPAGTAAAHGKFLDDGNRMVVRIAGLGELENEIAATTPLAGG